MARISIIIPVYNVERHIKKCIDSVLIQSTDNAEIECVIVDDCSPDNSMDIVHQCIKNYQGDIHFILTKHERNLGLSCARNTGFEASTGDYILFIDSDDYFSADCISIFSQVIIENPKADLVIGNHFSENRQSKHFPSLQEPKILQGHNQIIKEMYENRLGFYAWNKLVRRELLQKNNIFFVKDLIFEDTLWSYSTYQHSNTIILLPEVTLFYKDNNGSIMNSKSKLSDRMINSLSYITNQLLENVEKEQIGRCCILSFNFMMTAYDIRIQHRCKQENIEQLNKTRKRLIQTALKGKLFLICPFLLMMYSPFYYIQKISLFRHNFYKICRFLYLIG